MTVHSLAAARVARLLDRLARSLDRLDAAPCPPTWPRFDDAAEPAERGERP